MKILSYLFVSLLLVKINESSYMRISNNLKQINKEMLSNINIKSNENDHNKENINKTNSNKLKTNSKSISNKSSPIDKLYYAHETQYFYSSKVKYYKKVKISCNVYNCKPLYGTCDEKKEICTCMPGQVHVPKLLSKKRICRYQQYNWLYCLVLELLLPGLGILYFNDYLIGLAKIFLIPIVYYYWNDAKGINSLIISVLGWVLIIYHIKDISLLISNNLRDRNGVFPE